jgi:hypothetical protein
VSVNNGYVPGQDFTATPTFSNATLNGAYWVAQLVGQFGAPMYIIFDGNGGVTEAGGFNIATPPGTYQVKEDGSFTITINSLNNPQTILAGTLTSSNDGTGTVTQGNFLGNTWSIGKMSNQDLAGCQGTWSGTFTESAPSTVTHNITFAVDGSGVVTSFTGFALPVSGKMFCYVPRGVVAAFFKTGEASTNPYNQIGMGGEGVLSGNTIEGFFNNAALGVNSRGTVVLNRM